MIRIAKYSCCGFRYKRRPSKFDNRRYFDRGIAALWPWAAWALRALRSTYGGNRGAGAAARDNLLKDRAQVWKAGDTDSDAHLGYCPHQSGSYAESHVAPVLSI